MLHHLASAKCGQSSWDSHDRIRHSLCQVHLVWDAWELCEYVCDNHYGEQIRGKKHHPYWHCLYKYRASHPLPLSY